MVVLVLVLAVVIVGDFNGVDVDDVLGLETEPLLSFSLNPNIDLYSHTYLTL